MKIVCETCGKEVKEEWVKLKNPIMITEWDYRYKHTRSEVLICCGKIRMVDINTGKQYCYEITDEMF